MSYITFPSRKKVSNANFTWSDYRARKKDCLCPLVLGFIYTSREFCIFSACLRITWKWPKFAEYLTKSVQGYSSIFTSLKTYACIENEQGEVVLHGPGPRFTESPCASYPWGRLGLSCLLEIKVNYVIHLSYELKWQAVLTRLLWLVKL